MFKPDWVKFIWNLQTDHRRFSPDLTKLDIRVGESADVKSFYETMASSFRTERAWGPLAFERVEECQRWADDVTEGSDTLFLVLEDGKRIVGGSLLCTDRESQRHLVSGVFLVEEYRCRGEGVALLAKSLDVLAEKEFPQASVMTRSNVTAAKYLYPKFGAHQEKLDEPISLKQVA